MIAELLNIYLRLNIVASNIKAKVKWFNGMKGFGFVAPVDGSPDAFLHASVLSQAGYGDIAEGTDLTCEIVDNPRGPQVQAVISVDGVSQSSSDNGQPKSRGGREDRYGKGDSGQRGNSRSSQSNQNSYETESPLSPSGEIIAGSVKWFKSEGGFGFIVADDGGKDVFVHKSVLRRCNLVELYPDQRVEFSIQMTQKGREASWIAVLSN